MLRSIDVVGYLFLPRIRGLAIRGVAKTEGRVAARRYSLSDCARPTAETTLLTAMAALLSHRCAISPRCYPALSLRYAPNGETPNPREEQITHNVDAPQHPTSIVSAATAASCAAVRRADGWVPRPIGVYCFWFCFPCFLSPSFSGSLFFCRVVARFFFGELYRCSTVVWQVFLSRWLSTLAATAGWSSRYRGPSPRGEGLWQVPDWNLFHVGAH